MKFLKYHIGEDLDDIRSGDTFLDITSKAWFMREIIDKVYCTRM